MNVFRASLEQVDELAGLFNQYRVFYKKASNLAACRQFLQDRLSRNESVIFAARGSDGNLVGFTQLYHSFCSVELAPLVYLYDLFVDPTARRTGVARALMDAARVHAKEAGADRLQLETATDNWNAQTLYEDLGYVRESDFYIYLLEL